MRRGKIVRHRGQRRLERLDRVDHHVVIDAQAEVRLQIVRQGRSGRQRRATFGVEAGKKDDIAALVEEIGDDLQLFFRQRATATGDDDHFAVGFRVAQRHATGEVEHRDLLHRPAQRATQVAFQLRQTKIARIVNLQPLLHRQEIGAEVTRCRHAHDGVGDLLLREGIDQFGVIGDRLARLIQWRDGDLPGPRHTVGFCL